MRFVSPLLKRVVYPSLGKSGYFHRHARSLLTVVTYHGVLAQDDSPLDEFLDSSLLPVETFRGQLRHLKLHYDVISCGEFRKWLSHEQALPSRAILLTCDDGLLNNLTEMVPVLREENLDCLFFVTAGSCSETSAMLWYVELYLLLLLAPRRTVKFAAHGVQWPAVSGDRRILRLAWHELVKKLSGLNADTRRRFLQEAGAACGFKQDWKLSYLEEPAWRRRFALLRKPELQQLCRAGMTLGAHSVSHPVLSQQPADAALAEMVDSRTALLAVTDSVWAFAYPFGDDASAGEREFELAEKAGFECAFLNGDGILSEDCRRYALPRFHVCSDMALREFEAHVTGFHSQLRRLFA